jgi:hypothetical protein
VNDPELAQRICDYLNGLLLLDRNAIACLIANRVPCNQGLADHPTVQAGAQHGGFHVGLLGILNGLCGVRNGTTTGFINAIFEGDARELKDLLHFEVHTDE